MMGLHRHRILCPDRVWVCLLLDAGLPFATTLYRGHSACIRPFVRRRPGVRKVRDQQAQTSRWMAKADGAMAGNERYTLHLHIDSRNPRKQDATCACGHVQRLSTSE
ncbi:hypothetical protein B0H16DRAFT_1624086 [Mycena metata]|uniref:Secreted protein n=1 Tax=Mycena metata TaxID=1033252 RepID=A0AAD7H5J3_9AGAR|nr:hypothetical protein B0H16DRAFT_1624086 [Mycena metata]